MDMILSSASKFNQSSLSAYSYVLHTNKFSDTGKFIIVLVQTV